ncbi:MAG: PASTA domain-containing protein [Bacteroidaceae bacterium]|nr:PASTA domain-containing protein [Bacteroidaceae bacterium]
MENKDTASKEVKAAPVKRGARKSKMVSFKKRMNILWLETKAFFKGKKCKKKNSPKVKVEEKKVSTKKKVLVVVLNLLGMAAFVFLVPYLALIWVDSYTRHGEECTVPSVYGCELDVAIDSLKNNSLGYDIVEYRYREGVADNVVLLMHPDSGTVVKDGRAISLVLNTTERPRKPIPSVIDNRTYREAESNLRSAGFIIERVNTIAGEKDWVYHVLHDGDTLSNGDAIPIGARITVVVGDGNERVEDEEPEFVETFDI